MWNFWFYPSYLLKHCQKLQCCLPRHWKKDCGPLGILETMGWMHDFIANITTYVLSYTIRFIISITSPDPKKHSKFPSMTSEDNLFKSDDTKELGNPLIVWWDSKLDISIRIFAWWELLWSCDDLLELECNSITVKSLIQPAVTIDYLQINCPWHASI